VELNRKNVRIILLIITFAIGLYTVVQNLGSVYAALSRIWSVLSTVITGFCIAFVLNVPMRFVERKVFRFMDRSKSRAVRMLRRAVSLVVTLLVAFGIVILLLIFILPQISKTVISLAESLPGYLNEAYLWVKNILASFNITSVGIPTLSIDWEKTLSAVSGYIAKGTSGLIGTATTVTASVVSTAAALIFSLAISIYGLAQKEKIGQFSKRMLDAFLPEKVNNQILRIVSLSDEVFSNFIAGQLLESCILGILCYLGMVIFRFPYPEVIAVIIGVTSLVPMVGAFIGEIVGAFLILFVSPIKALLFLVFILCLQQLEGSLIYPRVVGKSVGVPGVLVMCAVIVGGNISGVIGALLGVPVCAVLYVIVREAVESRLANKARRQRENGDAPAAKGGADAQSAEE